jgi:flagellar protein FlaG
MQISLVNTASHTQTANSQGNAGVQQRGAMPEAQTASAVMEVPSKTVQPANEVVDAQLLTESVAKLNQAVKMMASNLQFTVDEETGIDVVKVVDIESKEIIRQFPSEEAIAIAKALDQFRGMLVSDKA